MCEHIQIFDMPTSIHVFCIIRFSKDFNALFLIRMYRAHFMDMLFLEVELSHCFQKKISTLIFIYEYLV